MTRQQRHHDMLVAIEAFWDASGRDRLRARRNAQAALREWRMLHTIPERAAFERAVIASKQRRQAA